MTPKQVESLREGLRRNVRMGADPDAAQATADALRDLVRRDWAVRVLDAASAHVARECRMWRLYTPTEAVWLSCHDATPDAARLAAVEYLLPTLPAEKRAELGERP